MVAEGWALTSISGDAGTGTQAFTYDRLSRVTGSSGLVAGTTAYTYDLDGNRTAKTEAGVTTTYVYDRTDELVSETHTPTSQTYTYDAFGTMVQKGENDFTATAYLYDAANRLTRITAGTTVATFTLDALGRFATRTVGSSVDTYGYVGTSETASEISTAVNGTTTATTDSIIDAAGSRLANRTTINGTATRGRR